MAAAAFSGPEIKQALDGETVKEMGLSSLKSKQTVVSSPDPTHYAEKGLVTFEAFLGCADSAGA